MGKLKIIVMDAESIDIICPHCDTHLTEIWRVPNGLIIATGIFVCPHCSKVLGIGRW